MASEHDQLRTIATGLQRVQQAGMDAHTFSALARQQTALIEALPARYKEVLLQLLDRLESSALFNEESCSFSPKGLLDSLQVWVDKAGAQL